MYFGTKTTMRYSYQVNPHHLYMYCNCKSLAFLFRCNPVVQEKCTKVAEEQCRPITREVCTEKEKKALPACQEIEKSVPKEVCETQNVTKCQPIMREVCDVEIRQRCESVAEEVPFEVRIESSSLQYT